MPWDRTWQCKDGRLIWISDMEDRHLLNTVGLMLGRSDGWRGKYMPHLLAELEYRRAQGVGIFKEKGEEAGDRAVTRSP